MEKFNVTGVMIPDRHFMVDISHKGSKKAIAGLIHVLQNHQQWDIRKEAAVSLYKIGENPKTIQALIAALKDKDRDVRWIAAEALGKMRAKQAIGALEQALRANRSRGNRRSRGLELTIEEALEKIIEKHGTAPVEKDDDFDLEDW